MPEDEQEPMMLPAGRTYHLPEGSPRQGAGWPRRTEGGKLVFKLPGEYGWMVSSSRVDRGFWLVQWGHDPEAGFWVTCGCEHGLNQGRMYPAAKDPICVHVKAAYAAERADGHPPRPKATIGDTSRFVD